MQCVRVPPTWDFQPLVSIIDCPNVDHHVHSAAGEVLIIR